MLPLQPHGWAEQQVTLDLPLGGYHVDEGTRVPFLLRASPALEVLRTDTCVCGLRMPPGIPFILEVSVSPTFQARLVFGPLSIPTLASSASEIQTVSGNHW